MAHYLDLVALGTVADVVPLDHCNRILVKQGLARIRAGHCRPGIQALIQVANRQPQHLVAADLGFALGPRLNAAGRLDDMSIGIQCLISRGLQQALPLAQQLDQMNQQRRQLESQMQNQALVALQQLEQPKQQTAMPTGLCIYHEQWHQGVVGILAARIKERYHRPVVAFAKADSQNLKGSARSIPGLHIRDLLATIDAQHPQLIDKFGGHAMAAGLSLKLAKLAQFKEVFNQLAKEQLSTEDLQQVIYSDGSLNSDDFSLKRAHQLIAGGPWGQHFAEPLFDDQFEILEQKVLAEKHLKLIVTVPETNQLVEAIAFNVDRDLWPNPCQQAHLVYRLNVNHYRGQQKLQLLVEALWPLAENSCKIDQSTG
jgi:single-stranded-DNA-specific exonuclease